MNFLLLGVRLVGQGDPSPEISADLATGTLTGRVIDIDFADGLRGVGVRIEGVEIQPVFTDLEGRYHITDLPAGSHIVIFAKEGFQTSRVSEVTIREGEVFTLDVPLTAISADFELGVFEITAIEVMAQNVALLADRQKAAAVSDSLGAEFMSRAGASDAAEAMSKMVGANIVDGKFAVIRGLGDRYSNTLMNGAVLPSNDPAKKTVQLDIIPADLLEKIVTTKTFTPDKPGDFTGGSVDIATKSFPEELVFNVTLGLGYNEATGNDILGIPGRDMDFLGSTDDALPDSIPPTPGEYGLATRFETSEEARTLFRSLHASGWYPVLKKADPDLSFAISAGDSINVGSEGRLGYYFNFTRSHGFSLVESKRVERWIGRPDNLSPKNGFDRTDSDEEISYGALANIALLPNPDNEIAYNYVLNSKSNDIVQFGDDGFENVTTVNEPGNPVRVRDLPEGRTEGKEFLITTRLKHTVKELSLHQLKGKHFFPGLNDAELNWTASYSETSEDNPDERSFSAIKYLYPDGSFDRLYITENPRFPFKSYDFLNDEKENYTVDFSIPLDFESLNTAEIKVGAFVSEATRDSLGRFFSARGYLRILSSVPESRIHFFENFQDNLWIDQTFPLGPPFRYQSRGQLEYNELSTTSGNAKSYEGSEDIEAFYLMTDFELTTGLRFIIGARHEATDMDVATIDAFVNASLRGRTGSIESSEWLPAFHVVRPLGPDGDMNLRFAYGKTLARPTFREFSPFRLEDAQSGEIISGNPDLEITLTDNIDARWEWFFAEGDLLAAGIYYKDFSKPIVQTVLSGVNSRPFYSWTNTETGEIAGVEFEARKSLAVHWSVGGNITFIDSELSPLSEGSSSNSGTVFEAQPDWIANLNLGYDNEDTGWAANLFYNYVGETLRFIGDETPSIFEADRQSLDANVQKTWGKFSAIFSAKNLLDEATELFYKGTEARPYYEFYKTGLSFSLSGSYKY
ncbi:MAG: TonB-dependent receptor [Opitutae bacterium]|nr:TonB-dependent receptor [Opitutae bacterium]